MSGLRWFWNATHTKYQCMVQIMKEFIQIHPQVVLIGRFGFRPIFVVSLEERFRETTKKSRDRKARSLSDFSELEDKLYTHSASLCP